MTELVNQVLARIKTLTLGQKITASLFSLSSLSLLIGVQGLTILSLASLIGFIVLVWRDIKQNTSK